MKCGLLFRVWFSVVLLAVATGTRLFAVQARYLPLYEEPDWLKIHVSELGTGFYSEGTREETNFKNTGTSVTHDYLFAGPSLDINAYGSIYHPNLLRYNVSSEGAFGYSYNNVTSGGVSTTRNEWDYLGRFASSVNFLENKPVRFTAFANYDHTFRDNDFFSRVTVDSWRYGARSYWQWGLWTLTGDYTHRDETSTSPFPVIIVNAVTNVVGGTNVITLQTNRNSLDQNIISHEDTATAILRQERASGGTSLNFTWDRYTRSDIGRLGEGTDESVSIGDGERFGANDHFKLNSSLSLTHRDTSTEVSDEMTASTMFSAEHRPNLNSFYNFNYDHFDTGDFQSDNFGGQATLQHQLYDSLTSSLTVRASDYDSSASGGSGYFLRYGGGWSEAYTKRIGSENRLRLSNTLFVEHTDEQNLGIVKNERHSFSEGGAPPDSFFLNLANVNPGTIIVTDQNNSEPPFLINFDYRIIQLGNRTLVERVTGSRIPVGAFVLVDYQAEPTPAGSYETITEAFLVRFEFWQNLFGVYGGVSVSLNNAPAILRVQELLAYNFGADFTWHDFRVGAEYNAYYATDSEYRSIRLFQSYAIHPDEFSSLNFDLTEAWIDYITGNRQEIDLAFISRYHRSMSRHLGIDADAGVSLRRGNGADQTLATFRPSLKYVIGKTTIDVGYDYEYELFLNSEQRQKQMFFMRYRRLF